MANIDNVLRAIETEGDEMWLRARIVFQFIGIRERLGYSISDVSKKMGVSTQLISRFERMEHSPTLKFIVNYAKALNADVDAILSEKCLEKFSISNEKLEKMNDFITYSNGEISIDVKFDYENETIWLTQAQIAELFEVDRTRITRHINNILNDGELDRMSTCAESAHMGNDGKQTYKTNYYNLDMIISIGYRVNSKRGIEFRRWASSVLKEYMYRGYVINQKKMTALNKTIEIQNRMLASQMDIDTNELANVINEYTRALDLLDDYDHQTLKDIKGKETIYRLTYEECRTLIDSMKFGDSSNVFGVEKEPGKLNGILEAVYQNVFGEEVYKSLESKAAHLLYFLVKDHPFVDGCKRIAATIFLEFLNKNGALIKDGKLTISNDALAAITLLTAESKPEEMDMIIKVLMNMLS